MVKEEMYKTDILKNFYNLCQIPHPSKKEEKMITYLVDWANDHKLEYVKDETGNVLIKKPATRGKENTPTVVLQSHMDMVCEKYADLDFDFDTEGLKLRIDGDWLKATGTTLGGDDGIGVAASLAVLESTTINHGPLECLFTVDEETGMTGVIGLKPDLLKGKFLLNLDSEDDGVLNIGCAGGQSTILSTMQTKNDITSSFKTLELKIEGLNGGHSGVTINRGLGNGIKLITRFLVDVIDKYDIELISLDGGDKHNAIPREIVCNFATEEKNISELQKMASELQSILRNEFATIDDSVELRLNEKKLLGAKAFKKEFTEKFINMLNVMPHGVLATDKRNLNFVETSTNLASVKCNNENITILTSQRSSVSTKVRDIGKKVVSAGKLAGFSGVMSDGYPAWEPKLKSKLVDIAAKGYNKLFGETVKIEAIHAGLECALIGEKYPKMEMVSFGPTIQGPHTPEEKLYLPTVDKFWKLILEILENI